jgi:transcriptional/translational regulatory protein YebC/TACO1
MFQHRGRILVAGKDVKEDALVDCAAGAGALDVQAPGPASDDDDDDADAQVWTVLTDIAAFNAVRDALEKAGYKVTQSELTMIPDTLTLVRGDHAKGVIDLIDALEDLDDVQKVYSNADIPDDVLAQLGA